MKGYSRIVYSVLIVVVFVTSGCGVAATPTPEKIVGVVVEHEVEREAVAPAQEWRPASPTATPRQEGMPDAAPGPSTGGSAEPNDQPYGDMFFEDYGVNPRIDTEDDHFSTFAVDVDTASYTVMRRYISDGFLPPDESVRVEEFINFFDQDYAPPEQGAFAIHLEGAPSPYDENYHLVRVGLKGYEIDPEERDDVVLTFVIDVSGSMNRENRLELVKRSLALLVDKLRPSDKVGIVVYGSRARVILEPTTLRKHNRRRVMRAIDGLRAGGSTYAEEGLITAYQMASRYFEPHATNRVILCSDGVANVGRTGPDSILEQIRTYAEEEDIYLTTVGVGMGNYNDVLLEQLADNGNGFYAYVDTLKEAERVFVHDLPSTLQVIARDAKVQVDFNPNVVRTYRLLGYENRDVADEDFRNDDIDAGEIGLGHSVTALYEVKFEKQAPTHEAAMTVYVRYEDPDDGEVIEISRVVAREDFATHFEEASPYFQLTAIVAQYAEILRHSYWAKESDLNLDAVSWEAARIAEYIPRDAEVQEFAGLVAQATQLSETR